MPELPGGGVDKHKYTVLTITNTTAMSVFARILFIKKIPVDTELIIFRPHHVQ